MCNRSSLETEILLWSLSLRGAQKKGSNTLRLVLDSFEKMLDVKKFTNPNDVELVRAIVKKMTNKFHDGAYFFFLSFFVTYHIRTHMNMKQIGTRKQKDRLI